MAVQILSWNVAGRVRSVADQAAAVAAQADADVVALQEVRASAHPAWRDALAAAGWVHQHYSAPPHRGTPERRLGVLIAARAAIEPLPGIDGLPWPERYAGVRLADPDDAAAGTIDVHALHAPISAKAGRVKVVTLEAVAAALGGPSPPAPPAVLVGDLNTPAYESREGETRSFARTRGGALRDGFDARHDAAELGLVPGLGARGWTDAFRAVHGYGARDRSWMYANRKFGYRLDHAFARGLAIEDCRYVHPPREAGLSDHSALWVRVASTPATRDATTES
jgi:exodeoxyribonuclease III